MNKTFVKASGRGCGGASRHNLFSLLTRSAGALSLCAALVGCGRGSDDATAAEAAACVLEVNGVSYSAADIAREQAFREALVRICRPKADVRKASGRIAEGLTNELVTSTLFLTAAQGRGIRGDESVTNAVLEKYRRTFARGKVRTLENLEAQLAVEGLVDVYTNNLAREIAREAYVASVHGDELSVTEKDVDDFLRRIKNYNAMVAATNALAYAKATNVWMRAKAGEDFAALADAESEDDDRQPGGELGECEKVDFADDPGYWEKVSALKEGEVSEVLTTDIGIEVVKALTGLAPSESTGEPAMKLARVYFRRAMSHPNWTREETRTDLEGEFRKNVMSASFLEVVSNATVVVNGERLDLAPKSDLAQDQKDGGE